MKMIKALIIFAMMFFLGCASFLYLTKLPAVPEDTQAQKVTTVKERRIVHSTFSRDTNQETDEDWAQIERNYKIKMLLTGQFHGDEVTAKSGERWLGLFKENDKYSLRYTKIKVSRVHDDIIDKNPKVKTGKKVSVDASSEPIFLLDKARMLKEGDIETFFYAADYDQTKNLENGFSESYVLNNTAYQLKVVNEQTSEKYITNGSKLVLESGRIKQVLVSLPNGGSDASWELLWVGDLDKDGKLDFYVDVSWHYNMSNPVLFLSSQAEKEKLVKDVADFGSMGC